MSAFNEDSRVKIPALLHLQRLGYRYLSLKQASWDARNKRIDERSLADASDGWITQQIERRRRDGISVCVIIWIKTGDLQMRLATSECGPPQTSSRRPRPAELTVLELWRHYHLNEAGFAPGQVVAFLARLRQVV